MSSSSPEAIIAHIFARRGISKAEQELFLHPNFQRDLHDPFLMQGMERAVQRLREAKQKGERIVIFGDYDADGVPATALLLRGLRRLGMSATATIPKRSEGYGLTMAVVERLIAEKTGLLITVDNGTVAQAEIAALQEAGIDVIVCDHHQPQAGHLAPAFCILNPKQQGCKYPFKELCGCGIAWKLLWALYTTLEQSTELLKWELDLVALSTVADMVPLLGENRVLVHCGLQVLQRTKNIGLRELAKVAGVDLKKVSTTDIGFRLAPRLNAPSRMHKEEVAGENVVLQLLTTEETTQAEKLAQYLNSCNATRQQLLETQLTEAIAQAESFLDQLCLVVYQSNWSSGVIGLIAGRLVEQYRRPVVVLANEGAQIKGSVRSVNGAHVVEMLEATEEHLERYGGHAKAGGLTMRGADAAAVEKFRSSTHSWLEGRGASLATMALAHDRPADLEIPLTSVTVELAEAIEQLAPFGLGFERPLFTSRAQLYSVRRVGSEGQHLSCILEENGYQCKGIAFGKGSEPVESGAEYQLWYTVQAEEWQGRRSVNCFIERLALI